MPVIPPRVEISSTSSSRCVGGMMPLAGGSPAQGMRRRVVLSAAMVVSVTGGDPFSDDHGTSWHEAQESRNLHVVRSSGNNPAGNSRMTLPIKPAATARLLHDRGG